MKNIFLLFCIIFFMSCSGAERSGCQWIRAVVLSEAEFNQRVAEMQKRFAKLQRRQEKWRAKEEKYAVINGLIEKDLEAMDMDRGIEIDSPAYKHILFQRYIIAQNNEAVLCLLDFDKEKLLRLGDPLAQNLYGVYKGKIHGFDCNLPEYSPIKFKTVVNLALWLAEQGKNGQFLANYYSHNNHFQDDLLPPEELTFSY